ncbi:hypothetical protein ACKFKG_06525 [Phormidesmis sp. 146-35]
MSASVLTDDFRQLLEQQRERLTTERDAIVQSAIEQATTAIDRSLDHINALLGGAAVASPNNSASNGSSQASVVESLVEEATSEPEEAPTQKRVPRKTAANTQKAGKAPDSSAKTKSNIKVKSVEPKGKAKSSSDKPFEAPKLKREFKDLTPAKAMEQVLIASPDQVFTTDEMIQLLFGSLDESVLPRTRQSVALMFSHGLRRQDYIKVQENPAQYKLNPERGAQSK